MKRNISILLILMAAGAVYFLARHAYVVGIFHDDAHYILAARALRGGAYVELAQPERPALVSYYPGFPLALALWTSVFGESFKMLRLLNIVLSLGIIALLYLYIKSRAETNVSLYVLVLAGFNSLAVSLSGTVLADPLFLFCVLSVFVLFEHFKKSNAFYGLFSIGCLAGITYLVRPPGLAFFGPILLFFLIEKKLRNAAVVTAGFAVMSLPWTIRNIMIKGAVTPYISEFFIASAGSGSFSIINTTQLVFSNILAYVRDMFALTLFRLPVVVQFPAIAFVLIIACTAFAVTGVVLRFRKDWVQILGIAGYCGVICLWPKYATRYLLPVTPFAAYYLCVGASRLWQKSGVKHWGLYASALLGMYLCLVPLGRIINASMTFSDPRTRAPNETYDWIKHNISKNDILAAHNEATIYLYTGRFCRPLYRYQNSVALKSDLEMRGIKYVVIGNLDSFLRSRGANSAVDPMSTRDITELLNNEADFERVFESRAEDYKIYKIR